MKNGRKKKSSQYYFRRKVFSYTQYWLLYYTERYSDKTEKDFATFIEAKSYDLAKSILINKTKELDKSIKVKAILGYMLHKDYISDRLAHRKLKIGDWDLVKSSSFPNINNVLFKKELPRKEGYTNRFNKATAEDTKGKGFKTGDDNWSRKHRKGKFLPLHERKGKKWTGDKWIDWDKNEMLKTKAKIIDALVQNKNNRKAAAEYLGIGRNSFYKLMARCEAKDWWDQKYPIAKRIPPRVSREERSKTQARVMADRRAKGEVFFDKGKIAESKRIANLQEAKAKQRDEYRQSLIPKIRKALSENNSIRSAAARSIGVKISTFRAWMLRTKKWVDWNNEYPSNYNTNKDFSWNKIQ